MKAIRGITCGGILFVIVTFASGADAACGAGTGDSTEDGTQAARASLSEIRDRAESMPIDARRDIDKRIGITVERINKEATTKGQAKVAARLAAEFGTTEEALLDQKAEHGLSYGELVIAHTLLANSTAGVTLVDLMDLRSEGLGWGAIAYGLRFHMEDFEDAIKAEGRVAMGLTKADGKAAVIGK